jgi:polyphosphate kinase
VCALNRYINRELSWLRFNERVLYEASNADNPLLERVRFLSIFESNLDEFFMVRVAGLMDQVGSDLVEATPDGLTPTEQLELIRKTTGQLRETAWRVFDKRLRPELKKAGIVIRKYESLSKGQKAKLSQVFRNKLFPLCTPIALTPAKSKPFISNRSLNLAVELRDIQLGKVLARIKVPTVVPRLIPISGRKREFALLEDVIANNLDLLFPGTKVLRSYRFRLLRDADIEIKELEAADLIASLEQSLRMRRFGEPVLLEVEKSMPKQIRSFLAEMHDLHSDEVMESDGILGFDVFNELCAIEEPPLRYLPHQSNLPVELSNATSLFAEIDKGDVLVHHPFDSFRPVEAFIESAAFDPDVIGIKITLYRVGEKSPIVEALQAAAEAGKQVTAMVELKARFDEGNNLVWARSLERAGVHVTYGFPELKTHSKLCLIVRRDGKALRRYAHIGTGNYNPETARAYTDLGLFTADSEITQDVAELFNALTAFSRQAEYRRLLVAPLSVRDGILERIYREIEIHQRKGGGRIVFKANSLVDPSVIEGLYKASDAGVRVELIIRGICCLMPPENIRVVSIVGRFLEHSRVYYFENGGNPEVWIGSADIMRRNLDRRIETLVQVTKPEHIVRLRDVILDAYLRDNVNAWQMQADGSYRRLTAAKGEPFSAQQFLTHNP